MLATGSTGSAAPGPGSASGDVGVLGMGSSGSAGDGKGSKGKKGAKGKGGDGKGGCVWSEEHGWVKGTGKDPATTTTPKVKKGLLSPSVTNNTFFTVREVLQTNPSSTIDSKVPTDNKAPLTKLYT